jgi:hypothetical protein
MPTADNEIELVSKDVVTAGNSQMDQINYKGDQPLGRDFFLPALRQLLSV